MTNSNNNNNNNSNRNPFGGGNNNQNAPAPAPSRFGSGSRFGNNSAAAPAPQTQQNPPPRFGSGSRFGSSGSRFGGREEVSWTVAPLHAEAVRISLQGLGDPLHRLLGTPLNAENAKAEKLLEALQKDEELFKRLSEILNEAWEKYEFRGAAMLYPWDEGIRKAYSQVLQPLPPAPPPKQQDDKAEDDEDEYEEVVPDWLQPASQKLGLCFRAIDTAFVLNILARSRANLVVGNTPLALEPGFLDQVVLCDDPRIVALAQATGCIEENW